MTWLLSFLAGPGGLYAALAAAIGAALLWYRRSIISGERNRNRAREADAYEKYLKEIADAANARPSGSVSDDRYNRDRG